MRRANHLLPKIIDPDNLRLASWKAAKGKRWAQEVLAYQACLEENLALLRQQIRSGLIDVGNYRYFTIYEPKERKICASAFREQVLHHSLMNVCHEFFDRALISDSYASRKGKGTYAAIDRAKVFTREFEWYLKLDVRKFFESIHHEVLKDQLAKLFKEKRLLEIFGKIIDSYETLPNRGVPIGNLTSQYFANHYLSGLDHFIKEQLGIRAYVRYMDDLVLWHEDKSVLKSAKERIEAFVVSNLLCELKPEALNRTRLGVPFLGYRIFPHHVWLLHQSKVRFARKMRYIQEQYDTGAWSEEKCALHARPLIAFTEHADAKAFRRKVLS
ncbi:MAG: reverse transcriptase [Lewinellaceae bacterium]|nr:reverse transcriptase [Lewinellaceae bacterium]